MPSSRDSFQPTQWLTGLGVCVAALAVGWAALWPLPRTKESEITPVQLSKRVDSSSLELKKETPVYSSANWARSIRWESAVPLREPVTAPVNQRPKAFANASRLVLLGTIIEGDRSLALLRDAMGKTDLKSVGAILQLEPSGIRVSQIHADHVVLRHNNHDLRVELATVAFEPTTTLEDESNIEVIDEPVEMDELSNLDMELDWLNGTAPVEDDGNSEEIR